MAPELFRIPWLDLPIYSYGAMMVIGLLGAIQLAKRLARRSGLDPELFVNAALLALVSGVVGARLSHVIENIHQYTDPTRSGWDNFVDAINVRSGGLTYYGGFLLAFPTLVIYAVIKKVPLRLGMDIVAPCVMIGLGFGRIGCFLNGCCYGDRCDLPWAMRFPYQSLAYQEEFDRGQVKPPPQLLVPLRDGSCRLLQQNELRRGVLNHQDTSGLPIPIDPDAPALAREQRSDPLHPAQLYSALTAFLIAGITWSFFTLKPVAGRVFALMLALEGASRFVLELLRVERPVLGTFSLSMILAMGLCVAGVGMWLAVGIGQRSRIAANRSKIVI